MKKQAFNPFLPPNEYVQDVEPHVFGNRIYLFGSHDKEEGETYCMLVYVGFRSLPPTNGRRTAQPYICLIMSAPCIFVTREKALWSLSDWRLNNIISDSSGNLNLCSI